MASGGKRKGAGRKPKLETQLVRAEDLAKQLQVRLKSGLGTLAAGFEDLMSESIKAAMAGDGMERRFLIKLLVDLVPPEERKSGPMAQLTQIWNIDGDINVAEPGAGHPVEAEYRVIDGADGPVSGPDPT